MGLLVTSLVFNFVYGLTGNGFFSVLACWMITAGILGGLLAAVFGLIDRLAIPAGTQARRIGAWPGSEVNWWRDLD